jgi:hypothetical protein
MYVLSAPSTSTLLTYVIRQDIASLNTQIASLQSYIRAQKQPQVAAGKGQVEEHNSNVVMMLQSRLADMGMGFKDVLELRTQVSEISRSSCEERIGECDFEIVMWRQHWRSVWSEKSYEGS